MFLYKLARIYAGIASIRGISPRRRRDIRVQVLTKLSFELSKSMPELPAQALQDLTFPAELKTAEKVMVVLVPQSNGINGGILSLFSIVGQLRRLKRVHGYEVVLMTLPSQEYKTHFRNTFFRNDENVYRFAQLSLCSSAKEIYLHIPEYAIQEFSSRLTIEEKNFLLSLNKLHINVLNQNTKLMPPPSAIADLRKLTPTLSQSVAFHATFTQEIANKYCLPTLLLPAYADLSPYPSVDFSEKEKLIIYSPDESDEKHECLNRISEELPDFKLVEIKNISFDAYMDLATRCMFSITFGEGFDGYLVQPIYQGGIGFSVYNRDFFPSEKYLGYLNIFANADEMVNSICQRMAVLSTDRVAYETLNQQFVAEHRELYSHEKYLIQMKKLSLKQFEIFPTSDLELRQ